jgi:hypothetical protein
MLFLFYIFSATAQDNTPLYVKVKRLEGQGNGGNYLNITADTRDRIMAGAPWKVQDVEYEAGASPIIVRMYNPIHVRPNCTYQLKITPLQNNRDNSLIDTSAHWTLYWYDELDSVSGSYVSQHSIGEGIEEFVEGHGIAITVKNHPFSIYDVGVVQTLQNFDEEQLFSSTSKYAQPDLVGSTVKYEGTHHWLGGVYDAETFTPTNWIRAGHQFSIENWLTIVYQHQNVEGANSNYLLWRKEDFFIPYDPCRYVLPCSARGFIDYHGQYEHIAQGLWAPYVMASPYDGGPKANYVSKDVETNYEQWDMLQPYCYDFINLTSSNNTGYNQTLTNLYPVDIVFTPDQTKWTRAIVLEAGSGTEENGYKVAQHFNGQTYYNIRHEPKTCPSVDQNGNPDNSGTTGLGWFPGYAINVETGERLNIMFSENSEDEYNRGNDMIFNPTNVYAFKKDTTGAFVLGADGLPIPMDQSEYDSLYLSIYEGGESANFLGEPLNGGRHYVYVCGSSGNTANSYYNNNNSQRNYNDNGAGGNFIGTDGVSYPYYECGGYDEGKWLSEKFKTFVQDTNFNEQSRRVQKMQVFNNVMWTSIPMPAEGEESNWLDNEATVQIRVARPYMFYSSAVGTHPDIVTNNNAPCFSFSMADLNTAENVTLFDVDSIIENPTNRIDVNAIDALIKPYSGGWFSDWSISERNYFYPKGSKKCTYLYYGFCLGGLDENDQLHVMGETDNSCHDSWPGPLSCVDASVDYITRMKWNRTFKITREEVTEFLANYQNPEYQIPRNIMDWPAHGDTTKGQAWLLAPFVDVDSNNRYEPAQGDYPDFPGDMALFVIFNDNYAPHTTGSGGTPLGVETHVMVYAYDAPEDTIMNNTIFLKYKIFNRSQHNYHDTYVGLENYWELGFYADNFVGCDIMRNTVYAYNGTPCDGCIEGEENLPDNYYGPDWPVQTLTVLSGPLMPADQIDNPAYTDSSDCSLYINNGLNEYAINGTCFGDDTVDNERYGLTGFMMHGDDFSLTGQPRSATDFYNYMRGYWQDGITPLKYGGTGLWNSTDINCRFSFYGNTDSPCNFATHGVEVPDSLYGPDGWTAAAIGAWSPIGFASMGPFNLDAGGMQEIELCMTTIPHYMAITRGDLSLHGLDAVNSEYRDKVFTPAITYTQHVTICEGETYTFFDQICDSTGLYRHRVRNSEYDNYLPDTVWLLYLTEEPYYTLIYAAVLPGQGYYENGFNISAAQTANPGTQMFYNTYTSHSGCDSSVVLLLDVNVNASIEDYSSQHQLKIYPNPTTQSITIELEDEALIQKHEPVLLYDIFGKLLQNRPLTDTHLQIDLSSYASGTYIVKVGNRVGKVVKR